MDILIEAFVAHGRGVNPVSPEWVQGFRLLSFGKQSYTIEVCMVKDILRELSFWERLKALLGCRVRYTKKLPVWMPIITFVEDNPKDPYVRNCALEAFDYLTKDITTTIK